MSYLVLTPAEQTGFPGPVLNYNNGQAYTGGWTDTDGLVKRAMRKQKNVKLDPKTGKVIGTTSLPAMTEPVQRQAQSAPQEQLAFMQTLVEAVNSQP